MPDSPAEQLRAAYQAWSSSRAADTSGFVAVAHPELEMRSPLLEAAGDTNALRGPAAVEAFLAAIKRDWLMLDFVTDEIVSQGDTVVWIGRCSWRHRASKREIHTAKIDVWHFREGRAVRFSEMFDTWAFARTIGMV